MFKAPATPLSSSRRWGPMTSAALACVALVCCISHAGAHGISETSRQTMTEGGVLAYIWLGAEHMLTGYDHLLFLFGVLFFLTGFRDVVRFITAFTLGHCITLLGATLAGITANPYLIDAVIALSVIYKGFENLDGFEKTLGFRPPNLLVMVFVFGLIHGFGLSTRLQELTLGEQGLISRILAFNVGVELGQVAALTLMVAFFAAWRSSKAFERFGVVANGGLVLAGAGLFLMQMTGYVQGDDHHTPHPAVEKAHDDHGHGHGHDHGAAAPALKKPAAQPHGHDHGHGHEAPPPAQKKPAAQPHGHDHGHGHEAPAPAPKKPAAQPHGHDHGHGHSHEAPAPAPKKPAAQPHGHDHGHGHSHEAPAPAPKEATASPSSADAGPGPDQAAADAAQKKKPAAKPHKHKHKRKHKHKHKHKHKNGHEHSH